MNVIAYTRVSTEEQGESGAGLAAQRSMIAGEAARRGWSPDDTYWLSEVVSTKLARRPRLDEALAVLRDGEADVLVAAKLDRICRSVLEYATLHKQAQKQGWTLLTLNCPESDGPYGKAMGGMLAVFAELERDLIGERTRDALAERRAEGVRLGRPPMLAGDLRDRICAERAAGATPYAIAKRLNAEDVPRANGGRAWYPATVERIAA